MRSVCLSDDFDINFETFYKHIKTPFSSRLLFKYRQWFYEDRSRIIGTLQISCNCGSFNKFKFATANVKEYRSILRLTTLKNK